MKTFHNVLTAVQWVAFLGGILGSIPIGFAFGLEAGLLAAILGFVALENLKLEVVSFR